MAHLQLSFLGPFQATLDGKPLQTLRSARIQGVLAYLALEPGRKHTREILAAHFWPDEPDEAAKQNLRQALYQLRQRLGDDHAEIPFLLLTRDSVEFNLASDSQIDTVLFQEALRQQRLHDAIALYRGELLTDLRSDSDQMEEWLIVQRERFHLLALEALQKLTEQQLAVGNFVEAQQYARRQLTLEPWRESAHRQLMRALAATGERSAALAHYESCRQLLQNELGVEPDAETQALVAQIHTGNDDKVTSWQADKLTVPSPPATLSPGHLITDWGEAPDVLNFQGRREELADLERWLVRERCRLVSILGMGGMGKTSLAVRIARQVAGEFEVVIWRSLLNAPPLGEILRGWQQVLDSQQAGNWPDGLDAQLALIFAQLRQHRCLLVLDNAESIMQGAQPGMNEAGRAGYFRPGYEEYGQLLKRIGETPHQSCLLLTSREQPQEAARLERVTPSVRTLALPGLGVEAGLAVLQTQGVAGSLSMIDTLVQRYSGNPLALILVADTIQVLFDGDMAAFLGEDTLIFDDIRDVLEQQFARLSALERAILCWLAIEREPCTVQQLSDDLVQPVPQRQLLEAINSLRRRSLLEKAGTVPLAPSQPAQPELSSSSFTLQNVITEFMTGYLIDQVCEELSGEVEDVASLLLNQHALLKAQTKEYVRQSQTRLILQPIGERLLAKWGKASLIERCQQMFALLRSRGIPGFAGGNLLNLLLQLGVDLAGSDFSDLNIWQAYLRGIDLPMADFTQSNLTGSVFTDYAGAVTSVAFSPDGQLLAAGTDNGAIYLWRVRDRQLVAICHGHSGHVWSLAFSPDSERLLSGGSDTTVRVWEVKSRQTLHLFTGHTRVIAAVAFHPRGTLVATGSFDGTVRLWNAQTGQLHSILQDNGVKVEALAFSPEGDILAIGGHDQLVHLWDWQSARHLRMLRGHTNLVKALDFRPQRSGETSSAQRILVSGSYDQTLCLWDVESGALLGRLAGHTEAVICVAFSRDGDWLISGSDDQTARIWEIEQPEHAQLIRILHGHYGTVRSLAVYPQPSAAQALLASGSYDKSVRLWDMQSGQPLAILRGHSKWLQALVFTPDQRLLVGGSDGQNVRVWDGQSGRALYTLRGHTSLTERIAFELDGLYIASASSDQTARIWGLQQPHTRYVLHGHTCPVTAVSISRDAQGRKLAATGGLDHTIRLWDVERGQSLTCWRGHRDRVVSVAFGPEGRLLASGSWDRTIGLWDMQSSEPVYFLHGHSEAVDFVAFHPTGQLLASASWDGSVRIWDVRTGQTVHTLQGHDDGLEMVTFSPDGRLLASCACDHLVCVWDVQSGALLYKLQGHSSWVRCVAFSPDSQYLASGSDDGTVKLWDITVIGRGACLQTVDMDDPYTNMKISGVTGITEAQKMALKALGAIEG